MPFRRSAPVKVVVFQWPWGTGARHRWPRLARPRSRAILVVAPVSSIKTRCAGSRSGCASNHASRRVATSGRCCSLACAVFFDRDAVAVEEAPDRAGRETGAMLAPEQVRHLDQRDVHLRIDRRQDHGAECLDPVRPPIAALLPRLRRARGAPRLHPAYRTGRRHPETRRSRSPRHARVNRRNHTPAKIIRKRPRHACWPPFQQTG